MIPVKPASRMARNFRVQDHSVSAVGYLRRDQSVAKKRMEGSGEGMGMELGSGLL